MPMLGLNLSEDYPKESSPHRPIKFITFTLVKSG